MPFDVGQRHYPPPAPIQRLVWHPRIAAAYLKWPNNGDFPSIARPGFISATYAVEKSFERYGPGRAYRIRSPEAYDARSSHPSEAELLNVRVVPVEDINGNKLELLFRYQVESDPILGTSDSRPIVHMLSLWATNLALVRT
jgi:hypothetical protein